MRWSELQEIVRKMQVEGSLSSDPEVYFTGIYDTYVYERVSRAVVDEDVYSMLGNADRLELDVS